MIRCEIRRCGQPAMYLPVLVVPGRSANAEGAGRLFGATAVCQGHRAVARHEDYVTDQVMEALRMIAEKMGLELADKRDVELHFVSLFGPGRDVRKQVRAIARRQGLL